ncbi:nop-domain-containing protein [Phaffia rhodozyma]|uniref:Nucleolar protein 56 n=1 Tax=Phaffia rhodozyma TaxID=264483 RepID=A0A0F7SEX7_PHARH|nr:nop-domain-containing protein [Phaffia rhodozyma]
MPGLSHVLYEAASGYALFSVSLHDDIANSTKQFQDSIADLHKFGKMVQLTSFAPFSSAGHALENANDVSEGILNPHLASLLELNLSKSSAKASSSSASENILLGVEEKNLAGSIKAELGIECEAGQAALELIRGVRLHAEKMLKGMEAGDVVRAQLGLGHSYSRAKVKFNVNRSDNMIIQAIALSDQLDKDVNTFAMRVREWYGWHFPELVKIVPDNHQYAQLAKFIGDKSRLSESDLEEMQEILDDDETRARNVLDGARASMGSDISPIDLINISNFADRVVNLSSYRKALKAYLIEKMHLVAPNLSALLGETIGARLISHAGSLTNLAKYPASTVQILGAEKALFRALKTKGNTPKYGLIYHSTFIGRAGTKHKGRISRFLANKCSIAARIDCFSDTPTNKFGEALRAQVEERLAFYESGTAVSKNSDAMKKALDAIALDGDDDDDEEVDEAEAEVEMVEAAAQLEADEKKRAKKEKKAGKVELPVLEEVKALVGGSLPEGSIETVVKAEKKDKKKKRKSSA